VDSITLGGVLISFEEPKKYEHGGAVIFQFDKEEARGTIKLAINGYGLDIYHLETSDQPLGLLDLFHGSQPEGKPFQIVIDSPWQTSDNMAFIKFWPEVGTRIQFECDVSSVPVYPKSEWLGYEFGFDWPIEEE
jgi:hypothetical protein